MRDADVGATPRPGPRPPAAHRSRRTARRPTGRSQPTTDRRIHVRGSAGVGDAGDIAPQQHSGAELSGQPTGGPDAVVTRRTTRIGLHREPRPQHRSPMMSRGVQFTALAIPAPQRLAKA